MNNRYIIWNKSDDVYTLGGTKYTAEQWLKKFPYLNAPGAVPILAAGIVNGALVDELSRMKARYQKEGLEFTEGMTNQEVLDKIAEYEDQREANIKIAMEEANNTPSAEERIAAALEYQSLATLM